MKKTLLALSAAMFAGVALAGTPGYYAYGGLGYAHADADIGMGDANDPQYFDSFSHNKDDKDSSIKLAAGYRFNENFAVEGSYTYLGKAEAGFKAINYQSEFEQAEASMTTHMIAIDALAIYPVNKDFEVFAKGGFGIARVKNEGSYSYYDFSFSKSKTRFVPKIGFGAEWNVTDNVAIRAEYWKRDAKTEF